MNRTVILIKIAILLMSFGIVVFGMLLISPLAFISSYPPEIQEAYYRSQRKQAERAKLTRLMILKKITAALILLLLMAWLAHSAGADNFQEGLFLAYLYSFCIFAWDTFFLDWVLFPRIKRIRLPGTEHMEKEYRQKWFHVKACIPMIPVFAVMGVLSSLLMVWIW